MRDRAGARAGPFQLFQQFPELRIGIFGKSLERKGDTECAKELGFKDVAFANQVHGNVTHVIECRGKVYFAPTSLEGDGLITKTPDLALSVRFADCQAFVTYAPLRQSSGQAPKKVIGVLHAGWRGMAHKAITAHFQCLEEHFGVKPSEAFVGIAPSLCKTCTEFSDPFHELPPHLHPFIEGRFVDLQAAADAELDFLGVPREQRERHPECTRCGEGCWSWRRDKNPNARNYLVVGMHNTV
jgi:copper oxidase (laccase) domain-containing protein